MRIFNRNITTKRILVVILCISIIAASMSIISYTQFGYGAGLVVGDSTTLVNQGAVDNVCGIPLIDEVVFEVGIQRDKDTYVDMNNGRTDVLNKFKKRIISNGANTLFFMSQNMYNYMSNNLGGKFVLSWYNPGNKALECFANSDQTSRITTFDGSPVNPTTDASFSNGGKYYTNIKTNYTMDTINSLGNGNWKNIINNNSYGGQQVWSWILQRTGTNTWDINNRLEKIANPLGLDLNNIENWTTAQQFEHKLRILDLLLMTYEVYPSSSPTKVDWENAINDWITCSNLKEQPVTFVITNSVVVNPGKPTSNATGHIITRTIDYINYVAGIEESYMLNKYNYNAVVPATTAPAGGNNTYKNLEGSINQSIAASPTFNRISNAYNRYNGFSYGMGAIAKYRLNTGAGYLQWANTSVTASYLDILKIPEINVSGYMMLLTAPVGSKSLSLVVDATPDEEVVSTPTIGKIVTINVSVSPEQEKISAWQPIIDLVSSKNGLIDVEVDTVRTPAGGTYTPDYSTITKKYTASEFLTLIQGTSNITIIDTSVGNEAIAENQALTYKYDVTFKITADGEVTTLKGSDTSSFLRQTVGSKIVRYVSNPLTWAEIKEGSPYKESFEAMAGVPTTEKLYFGSGGSEFMAEIELEYKTDASTERTYKSAYTGTDCEFKAGDTSPNKSLGGQSVDMHNGGTYSKTWTGTTAWTGSGGVSGYTAWHTDSWNDDSYNAGLVTAGAFATQVNGTVLSHTAASDGITRSKSGWGASASGSNPHNTGSHKNGQPYIAPTPPDADGHGGSSGQPFVAGTYTPGTSNSWSITVTWKVPAHIICGPCCQHVLPAVEDEWKQNITYDYMRINSAHIWKIDQASVNGMTEITGTDTIKSTIVQGDPNIFYNIADLGNPVNDGNDSYHGRLRYTIEPQQHDTVIWNEGTRTNKCNGIVSNSSNVQPVAPDGHQNAWATGILYNNTTYTNELNYHRDRGGVSTTTNNVADTKDVATAEWARFNQRRTTLNTATVISDMLILQTSSGDQSVIYFQKNSTPKQTQMNFDKVAATKEEMWDNNATSASKWTTNQINIGSYNGNYKSTTTKYEGTGNKAQIATKFDSDPAKVSTSYKTAYHWINRPVRSSKLLLYKDSITQKLTNVNKTYITGKAETFWASILDYPSAVGAMHTNTYQSKYGKNGYVKKANYSPNHSKINNIIVHNPVSAEDAVVVGLPEDRDQRSTMPIGSSQDTLDNINALSVCPRDPGLCEFRVLNCTYFDDRLLASFSFENGATNDVNNSVYTLPAGFTIENVNRFGTGKSLSAQGIRWSIPFADLGLTYSADTKLYIEADYYIPGDTTIPQMLVSTYSYDFYLPDADGYPTWNTGRGNERRLDTYIHNQKIKIGLEFDFNNLDYNKVFINGVEKTGYTRFNESAPITATVIGNTLNIGSWGHDNKYPARFYLDNLKITKRGGTHEHNVTCYKPVAFHPDGLNKHVHTAACLNTTDTGTAKQVTFNYNGNYQEYVAPMTGEYKLEVWGAQGGNASSTTTTASGGLGGYSTGNIQLKAGEKLRVYVGGQGITGNGTTTSAGGFNGGGNGYYLSGGGGGATDIRKWDGIENVVADIGFNGTNHNASNGTDYIQSNNGSAMIVKQQSSDGYIYLKSSSDNPAYGKDTSIIDTIEIRIKNNTGGNYGHLYFGTSTSGWVYENGGRIDMPIMSTYDSEYKIYRFNINRSTATAWGSGTLTGFRLDMANGVTSSGTYEIDYIKLIGSSDNLIDRVIVAGGGGGAQVYNTYKANGGAGGGTTGANGISSGNWTNGYISYGGSQSSGGTNTSGWNGAGSTGQGGSYYGSYIGGGGGGYYGGAAGAYYGYSGAGGSGYIGGVSNGSTVMNVRSANGIARITEPRVYSNGVEYAVQYVKEGNTQKLKDILGSAYEYVLPTSLLHTWAFSGTDTKGFSGLYNANAVVESNKLAFNITGQDPQIGVAVNLDAKAIRRIKIYFDNYTTSTSGAVLWGVQPRDPAVYPFDGSRAFTYGMTANQAGQVATIDTSTNANWTGTIDCLRLDCADWPNPSSGSVKISKIELYGYGTVVNSGEGSTNKIRTFNNTSTGYTGSNTNNSTGTLGETVTMSGGMYYWTVPTSGHYYIEAYGAQGGSGINGSTTIVGGYGASMKGEFSLTAGNVIKLLVGQRGGSTSSSNTGGGGGGGTFVVKSDNTPLVIAGGGGGGGDSTTGSATGGTTNTIGLSGENNAGSGGVNGGGGYGYGSTGGGGGLNTNGSGTYGGLAFVNGGNGINASYGDGGFGGGGSADDSSKDNGAGGGGYSGGGAGDSNASGGGGGSYNSGSNQSNMSSINIGHGKIIISSTFTPVKITFETESYDAIKTAIIANLSRLPDKLSDGSVNPIWTCGLLPLNTHVCNENCYIKDVLMCSEPHHYGLHYDGSNDICWDACNNDANHKYYKPTVTTPTGETIPNGKFINIDWPFKVYFPNIGDFDQGQIAGIASLTTIRGKGYIDNMNTTKWTREKRVKFSFNVIFNGDGKLYRAGEWIELPVTGSTYPYYDFYCVLANYEAKSATVEYEVEANNCPGNNDNTVNETNRNRISNYTSYHGAYKSSYIDVVGRIGNLVIDDTEDYRFSNFFKVPVAGDDWLIEGVVRKVYNSMQNNYIAFGKDLRGIDVAADTNWFNTYGTQNWLNKKPSELPLSPEKNNLVPLRTQPMRPGYDVLMDISTIGNYRTKMQIVPYYYAFDLLNSTLTPVDVYISSNGQYKPINIYDIVKPGWSDGKNIVGGSTEIGAFESAKLNNVSIVNTTRPDTGVTTRAIRLDKDKAIPLAYVSNLNLNQDTNYKLEFDYWADTNDVKFDVDLWPDELPQKINIANKTVQHASWTINSSSTNMNNSTLRFFNDTVSINPANIYITNIELTNGIYPYVMNLDWVNESERRNYDILEKAHTDALAEIYSELVKTPDATGEMVVTGKREMDRPVGKYYSLGTSQLIVPSGKARTFIGSETTNGVFKNIGNKIPLADWWYAGQRWHFKLGLPSSSVFVEHGKETTIEEVKKFADANHVILMTADIQSVGDTYVLRYLQGDNNGTINLGGKTYVMPASIPPVVAVYSANKSAVQDVDIRGTH